MAPAPSTCFRNSWAGNGSSSSGVGFRRGERRYTFYSIADVRTAHPEWFREDLARLFALALQGKVTPIIGKRLPPTAAAEAHSLLESGKVGGNIILQISPDTHARR